MTSDEFKARAADIAGKLLDVAAGPNLSVDAALAKAMLEFLVDAVPVDTLRDHLTDEDRAIADLVARLASRVKFGR